MSIVHTIGHSNHAIDTFIALLAGHGITMLVDVRSHPASRRFPQFDKRPLQACLEKAGIRYVFLGDGLGARPRDSACYRDGRADFVLIRATAAFANAIALLKRDMAEHRICLMCAEREPAECHRTWLVAQALHEDGIIVRHILADGAVELHDTLLRRLAGADFSSQSLFGDDAEILAATAQRMARQVAFRPEEKGGDV